MRTRPVQARAIATVEHILAVAARLLDDVGVDAFNTNLLAERADVRVRTIYRYFPNKHAIILELAARMYERADASLKRSLAVVADPAEPWWPAIEHTVDDYFATMLSVPGWIAIRRALQAVPGLDELRKRTVARHAGWLADALVARGIDAKRGQARYVAQATFAAASALLAPALQSNARQRNAIVREIKVMLRCYLASYLG